MNGGLAATAFGGALVEFVDATIIVLVVEDLSVRGMVGNHHLARFIADGTWSEFWRMLAYKTQWYGSQLVIAPHSYCSTKTCSVCGHIEAEMPLGPRVLRCEACGTEIDRGLQAARNLASPLAGSSPEGAPRQALRDPPVRVRSG